MSGVCTNREGSPGKAPVSGGPSSQVDGGQNSLLAVLDDHQVRHAEQEVGERRDPVPLEHRLHTPGEDAHVVPAAGGGLGRAGKTGLDWKAGGGGARVFLRTGDASSWRGWKKMPEKHPSPWGWGWGFKLQQLTQLRP